jgi:hypothetical protein
MSHQSSQDSQTQSDQESVYDNGSIETQSICNGPYESCFNCPDEPTVEGSCFCFECYLAFVLILHANSEDEDME